MPNSTKSGIGDIITQDFLLVKMIVHNVLGSSFSDSVHYKHKTKNPPTFGGF